MKSKNRGYSLKNIPIPLKANYLKSMMVKVENFIKRIRWKAHFFDNPMMRNDDNYTNYGFRSNISPSQNPALTSFKADIYDMVRNIEFRKVRNDFQGKLKEDGLVVKALDYQPRGPVFKTTGCLQGQLSLSFFHGR